MKRVVSEKKSVVSKVLRVQYYHTRHDGNVTIGNRMGGEEG